MLDATVTIPAFAAGITGITFFAAVLTMLVLKQFSLYVFVIALRGHARTLEAVAAVGGAAEVNELHAHLATRNRIIPTPGALLAILRSLASRKLLHAVPGDGSAQRYLLTYQGRCRLEGRRG